jgi:hypothetical protein
MVLKLHVFFLKSKKSICFVVVVANKVVPIVPKHGFVPRLPYFAIVTSDFLDDFFFSFVSSSSGIGSFAGGSIHGDIGYLGRLLGGSLFDFGFLSSWSTAGGN